MGRSSQLVDMGMTSTANWEKSKRNKSWWQHYGIKTGQRHAQVQQGDKLDAPEDRRDIELFPIFGLNFIFFHWQLVGSGDVGAQPANCWFYDEWNTIGECQPLTLKHDDRRYASGLHDLCDNPLNSIIRTRRTDSSLKGVLKVTLHGTLNDNTCQLDSRRVSTVYRTEDLQSVTVTLHINSKSILHN